MFFVQKGGTFEPPPKPVGEVFSERMKIFRNRVLKRLRTFTPIGHDEFLAYYGGRRLGVFTRAVESLKYEAVSRKDSYLTAFVKREKINFTKKKNPAPRVIQPRTPRYNVKVGCYLKPIEHDIYCAVGKVFGNTTIAKGLNALQRGILISGKWGRFKKPVGIGLDASRFDQHMSEAALKWEHSIYLALYRNDKFLAKLLRWQIENKGFGYCSDGKLKYNVNGCRMSGDMNTALGNCLIMCGLVWSFMADKQIDFEFINDGDDGMLIFEQCHYELVIDGLHAWFYEMGFTMQVEEPVFELEHVEFCQSRPVWTVDGYLMVRNPLTAVAKDVMCLKGLGNKVDFDDYFGVLGAGGLSLSGGIPIWQDFYSQMAHNKTPSVSHDKTAYETGFFMLAKSMTRKYKEIHPRTRCSFWLAYGIVPDHQIAIEADFRTFPFAWQCPEPESGLNYYPSWY